MDLNSMFGKFVPNDKGELEWLSQTGRMETVVVFTDINESDLVLGALRAAGPVGSRIADEIENQTLLFWDGKFRRGIFNWYDRYMTGKYIEQTIKRFRFRDRFRSELVTKIKESNGSSN